MDRGSAGQALWAKEIIVIDIEFQTIFKYVIVNGIIGMFWLFGPQREVCQLFYTY